MGDSKILSIENRFQRFAALTSLVETHSESMDVSGPLQEVSLQPRILPNTQTSHSLSTQDLAPMEIGPPQVVLLATLIFFNFTCHMGAVQRGIYICNVQE